MAASTTHSYGPGFTGLLGILFIALKLTGVIDWSWWWVLAPLWGGLALMVAILFGGALIAAAILGISALCKWLCS